ncbi:MAG: hypothetical protein OXR66_07300 [Candidatus Woesearchaeota archaeon]|nr:hypothetical protein [Candidatus Woesearchaeota archaeon]
MPVEQPTDNPVIVDKPLPETKPQLPFSPEELRAAAEQKKAAEAPKQEAPQQEEHIEITHDDVREFESTLQDMDHHVAVPQHTASPATPPKTDGFFSEFEQFAMHENMEAEGMVDKDLLQRMKEFHRARQDGKQYYVYSKDVKDAMQRKLNELKVLEQEWFHAQTQIDELQRGLHTIEHEIESRTNEVKTLMIQAKSKSKLEEKAEPGNEFVLKDGRKLTSLLDLKIALRTMPEELFRFHVNARRHDLAAWVQGGLKEKAIAQKMVHLRDRSELLVFLNQIQG